MNSELPSIDDDDFRPCAAAILDDDTRTIDAQFAAFAFKQGVAGLCVRGLYMTHPCGAADCKGDMVLVDIATQEQYLVSQPLGQGSNSCRADPGGFARASRVLRDALDQAPDLVICNRFGGLESENGGFAAELLALMASGVPLLTVVASAHVAAWRHFSGDALVLSADPADWQNWLDESLRQRYAAPPGRADAAAS